MTTADRVLKVVASRSWSDVAPTLAITFDELGLDSLDVVEIVMDLEQEFDFEIPDSAAEQLRTVGDAIRYVEQNAPGAG